MMSNKRYNIIYKIATGLLTALLLTSAGLDIFYHDMVSEIYTRLGYPTSIIYPLGVLKILGVIAIWLKKTNTLKKLAYVGFFFSFIVNLGGHISVNDGQYASAIVGILLLGTSYMYNKKIISS